MKSLYILALLACSTLIGSSGVSADVIDTETSIVLEDNTNAAAIVNVVTTDAMVTRGNVVSCDAVIIPASPVVALEGKNELCIVTIGQADAISYPTRESWRPWYHNSDITGNQKSTTHSEAYRQARDGLMCAWRLQSLV